MVASTAARASTALVVSEGAAVSAVMSRMQPSAVCMVSADIMAVDLHTALRRRTPDSPMFRAALGPPVM
ncbi:MAG: hypothetical protein JSS24_03565 [Proteobacteria bacterium]|nr:hypothetical protein [Pseudomonadota bacterium]